MVVIWLFRFYVFLLIMLDRNVFLEIWYLFFILKISIFLEDRVNEEVVGFIM